jgi:hypothetical protein
MFRMKGEREDKAGGIVRLIRRPQVPETHGQQGKAMNIERNEWG